MEVSSVEVCKMTDTFCRNFSAWTFGQGDSGTWMFSRARCKSWDCEYCANINRKIWWHRIVDAGKSTTHKWTFCTITAHERSIWYGKTLENLREGWRRLLERMRRRFKSSSKWLYIRVYELTEGFSYHIHFLIDRVVPERWLKGNARECGMGYMANCKTFTWHEHEAFAGYVCKYMVKGAYTLEKGIRRIQASVNFPKQQKGETNFRFIGQHLYIEDYLSKVPYTDLIVDAQLGTIIDEGSFWDDGRYVFDALGKVS